MTDIIIVGGGIAGLATAGALLDLGLSVALIEAEPVYRDRIRGEALHPWGAAEADQLGSIPVLRAGGAVPLALWQRYDSGEIVATYDWRDDVPGGHVEWAVSHPGLQDALLAAVAPRLTRLIRPGRVTGLRRVGQRVEVDVAGARETETLQARLVIGADGLNSGVRKAIGGTARLDPVDRKIGGVLVAGITLAGDRVHQASPPGEMAVVFPRGEVARCYFVCDTERATRLQPRHAQPALLAALGIHFPAGALATVTVASPSGFFPAADTVVDRLSAPGVVLVGDAAGANDPAQGHGLSLSLRDARDLRNLLRENRDWDVATTEFARRRVAAQAPLRAHARWVGDLLLASGPGGAAKRERARRAREADPTLGGYAGIHAFGPAGLDVSDAARRHFLGEDLPD